MGVVGSIRNAVNAFIAGMANSNLGPVIGQSYGFRPGQNRFGFSAERTIVSSIYTRISMDVAATQFRHVLVDSKKRYQGDIDSPLNEALTLQPNIDQGPRHWRQDIVATMFDAGAAAIVPVDFTIDPQTGDLVDIYTIRVGQIIQWYPKHVRISLYNEDLGRRQDITLEKRYVAIAENPFFSVMNEPNSTLQRLIKKLNLLDVIDDQSGSGKLDLIIQLPYVIKSEARKKTAEQRRKDIEVQLSGSKYGIAYADGTEKITQLNRPAENQLLGQVEYLIKLLYTQLGIPEEVMNGTADEKVMLNYVNRTTDAIVDSILEAMQRTFIGAARTNKLERIMDFYNPFRYVPMSQIADIADKFTRNKIASSNEIRNFIRMPPSDDPSADLLENPNMPVPATTVNVHPNSTQPQPPGTPPGAAS